MIQPFPYQSECRNALDKVRAEGRKNALVTMASGLGKTVTGALDAQAWLASNGGRFLYLCHQNDIINQSRTTFESVLGPAYTYGCFHGQERRVHDRTCVFASFQTMRDSFHSFAPTDFDYILVDESHHTSALTYLRVVEYFKPKFLLGMTATPERRDGQNIHSVYGEEVYYLPLEEALARNLLTPVDYRLMTDQVKLEPNEGNLADLNISETDGPIFTQISDSEIWAKIQENSKELADPRIIIFVETIERAEELMNVVPGGATIHSKVPTKERLVRLGLFRAGIISTVITVDCFNEGVDVPEANVIAFLRSTSSSRIFLQQLGRGLRRCEGKDKVIVLDFVGNSERLLMLEDFSSRVANCIRRVSGLKGPDIVLNESSTQTDAISGLKFDKKVRAVLDVVKRGRRQRVSDIPEMVADFSSKNRLHASRILADSLKTQVWWNCAKCGCEWQSSPGIRKLRGEGCPKCAVELREDNNLLISYPHLGKEYSQKNPTQPDQVHPFSLDLVWWECSVCNYEYRARVKCRVQRGDGCPSCAAKTPEHHFNLAFKHPELAAEYSHENSLSPEHIGTYSSNRWFWNCSVCGQGWWAGAGARARGRCGCPRCAVEKVERPITPVVAVVPKLQLTHETPQEVSRVLISAPVLARNLRVSHPDLVIEYSHRNPKPAEDVLPDLEERLWWVCSSCGRYWQATYRERMDGVQCKRCPKPIQFASVS